ncbi:hypothetical protein HK104_008743 [Borealophlyctis nickersoniae]|nr:hypothetical protein HK104_008743 [Borealophlyctis nickersoniae]
MSHSRTRSTDSIPALTDNLSSLSIPASSPRPASITSIHSVSGNTASVASTPSSAAFGAAIGSPQASGAAWVGAFQKYDCKRGNITVGLNPRALVQQLMLVDDEDKITIRADESEGGIVLLYELYFESPDLGKKCLYEMDAIPRIDRLGPLPRTKYQIVCQIAADEFARIIGALADVSDKIVISANKNSMTFMATGSDGTLQVGLVQKPAALGETTPRFKVLSFHHTVRQTFDSRYLRGFTLATPLSPSVVLHLGTGRTPLRVTYPIVVDSVGGSESLVLSTAASAKRGVVRSPGEDAEGVQQVVGQLHYVLYPEAEVGGL